MHHNPITHHKCVDILSDYVYIRCSHVHFCDLCSIISINVITHTYTHTHKHTHTYIYIYI